MLTPQSGHFTGICTLLRLYRHLYLRLLRGAMLNQWHQPYVFYARTRGLPDKLIFCVAIYYVIHSFCADGARNEYSGNLSRARS